MRITVSDVLEYLARGMTPQEILDDFPELTLTDIQACLAFAAEREKRLIVPEARGFSRDTAPRCHACVGRSAPRASESAATTEARHRQHAPIGATPTHSNAEEMVKGRMPLATASHRWQAVGTITIDIITRTGV